jgi:DNA-binding PadR family transcriptional regulator
MLHGYGILRYIRRASDELLRAEEGSLYPALHRMEHRGWIGSEWALTETGRRAKYYRLLAAERKRLCAGEGDFEYLVKGLRAVLLRRTVLHISLADQSSRLRRNFG